MYKMLLCFFSKKTTPALDIFCVVYIEQIQRTPRNGTTICETYQMLFHVEIEPTTAV